MLNEFMVRLTNFCNETCNHCVFRSGPDFRTHMTEELADQINAWIPKSLTTNVTMVGGELTLLPNYPELMQTLCQGIDQAGIMTNGVFVKNDKSFNRFLETIINLPIRNLTVRVSQSQYHTTEYGLKAYEKLLKALEEVDNRWVQFSGHLTHIIPFGRAFDNSIGQIIITDAMCESALGNVTFIDEEGFIHLCPMGNSRHKHISEDSYDNIRIETRNWQTYKVERGMTCLSCSSNGIGHCGSEIIPSRVESTIRCDGGTFNGKL